VNDVRKEIYIVGAGGFGKEVADTIVAMNREEERFLIAGYIDDDPALMGKTINGVTIVGNTEHLIRIGRRALENARPLPSAILSVSEPAIKRRLAERLEGSVIPENIIHPSAVLSPYAVLGKGIVIQASVYVAPNAEIGDHVHVNVLSSVGHDVRLGAFASVMVLSALSGYATLGRCGYIATGVTVLPGVHIGENTHVGAGTVVTKDIPADVVAYGAPCRVIREKNH
jgi:sugar O-acyltransferase (sialic acid O-acetyltransferase NeuD family)